MPFFLRFFLAAALIAFTSAAWGREPEKRIALVIGNAAYEAGALPTGANDAGLIAQTLQAAGFDVGWRKRVSSKAFHRVRSPNSYRKSFLFKYVIWPASRSPRRQSDEELSDTVRDSFLDSARIYGATSSASIIRNVGTRRSAIWPLIGQVMTLEDKEEPSVAPLHRRDELEYRLHQQSLLGALQIVACSTEAQDNRACR